ncbi:hypothetical protein K456DRAFT_29580 [Colletotrichum gloeosporioides 23]|nr:hypothetical protein K456DRAFT_29580 [Colletotrichum gloeosporioides 23]
MAPSQSGHAIVRYRRHTPFPEKGRFCTGYSTIYQAKWDENKEKCIIYQLPHEILLCILKCLDAPSMYMARQASSLMRSFYNDFSFRYFHYVLRDKQDHIVPGAPLGFQHCVLVEHRSNIIKLLQSDEKCRRRHVSIVSGTCRRPGISHRGDALQVVFRSDECWDILGIREGEEPPTIYRRWPPMNSDWTIKVLYKDEAPVGMFMASTASHGVRCASCNIHYDWTLDEGDVLLRVKGPVERFPAMLCTRSLTGAYVV